jgi:hypothetical protein
MHPLSEITFGKYRANFFFGTDRGSGRINHRIFSFHRKFSLNKMTGWRFETPTFGTESLQIEPRLYPLSYHSLWAKIFQTFNEVKRI